MLFLTRWLAAITYKMRVPYGVKQSESYRAARRQARRAARNALKMKESKGLLLDGPKSSLRMNLMQNTGIAWYRSLQICKHLEMHERAPSPSAATQRFKQKITQVASLVKRGR